MSEFNICPDFWTFIENIYYNNSKLEEIFKLFLNNFFLLYFRAFGNALEVIPSTLAENAGLNPIATVTDLRNRHVRGEISSGINVRRGAITDIVEENVVQPLLVSTSALTLATETVRSILKIDDIVCFYIILFIYILITFYYCFNSSNIFLRKKYSFSLKLCMFNYYDDSHT